MKKRKINKPMIIFGLINSILLIILSIYINIINIIPFKYCLIIILLIAVFDIIAFMLFKSRNKFFKALGIILSVITLCINAAGIYFATATNYFLNNSFNNASGDINTYYVITLNSSEYKNIKNIDNKTIGYYNQTSNIDLALTELSKTITTNNVSYDDLSTTFSKLDENEVSAILIEQTFYNYMLESNLLTSSNYKILYEFDIVTEGEKNQADSDISSFNIYIGGTDFTELYTDFNMIVTINKNSKKILLTSTPRDFYVELYGKDGARDILGYAGVWGINTSIKTLENLYNINIDYYIKINTESLVGLVDALDGVEFCSDISYTTTHAMLMGTYADSKGEKLQVSKGCKTYSGIEILTIARERKAYSDGDRQRQKNCQQIMISIFNKLVSIKNITNYTKILDAVSNLYTTNIPKSVITNMIKDMINNNTKWTFEQQSVTGYDSTNYVHLSNFLDYVMVPNQDSVDTASAKIKAVESEN